MRAEAILKRALASGAALALTMLGTTAAPAQDAATPRADGYTELERLPDWSGVWAPDWSLLFGGGAGGPPAQPQLTPAAAEKLAAFRAKQAAEGVDQYAQAHCIPPGMPGIMRQPYPIEILFTPGRVTIFAETYSQARRIYTDERPLPEDPDTLFNGTSVGRWDGDTLLVETVGFSEFAGDIGPGIPHGPNMTISERIWLERPDVLRFETTITDPEVLAAPYVQQLAFRKEPEWEIREYVCEENNRLTSGGGGANIDLGLDEGEDPFGVTAGE
jgi:hypothetical protein